MARSVNRAIRVGYDVVDISGTIVKVIEYDSSGNIRRAEGLTVPSSLLGFAKGGQFVKTDASSGTKSIYENQGTTKSCSFDLMGSVAAAEIIAADGASFVDTNGNEILEWVVTASAVNHLGIANAGTGVSPVFIAEGEADTGFLFVNSEAEEVLILDSIATSVNELTIQSAATGSGPVLQASGDDTDIDLNLNAKGTGAVVIATDEAQLTSTNSGALGAQLSIIHNGGSQIAGDVAGRILFTGQDDAAAATSYGQIDCVAGDASAADPDGTLIFYVNSSGTLTQRLQMDGDTINGIIVGGAGATAAISSNGGSDLQMLTGSGTGGEISIGDGAGGGIELIPNGTGAVLVGSADAGALGAQLQLMQQGGSQAVADIVGRISFLGEDDAQAEEAYAVIEAVVTDASAANPAGAMSFKVDVAGSLEERIKFDDSDITLSPSSSGGVVNATAIIASVGVQIDAQSVTATADGLTTGLIKDTYSKIEVTSVSSDNIVTLPEAIAGLDFTLFAAATGFEIRTVASSTETINGSNCDGTNELAIAAGQTIRIICHGAGKFIAYGWDSSGAAIATLVPDAA